MLEKLFAGQGDVLQQFSDLTQTCQALPISPMLAAIRTCDTEGNPAVTAIAIVGDTPPSAEDIAAAAGGGEEGVEVAVEVSTELQLTFDLTPFACRITRQGLAGDFYDFAEGCTDDDADTRPCANGSTDLSWIGVTGCETGSWMDGDAAADAATGTWTCPAVGECFPDVFCDATSPSVCDGYDSCTGKCGDASDSPCQPTCQGCGDCTAAGRRRLQRAGGGIQINFRPPPGLSRVPAPPPGGGRPTRPTLAESMAAAAAAAGGTALPAPTVSHQVTITVTRPPPRREADGTQITIPPPSTGNLLAGLHVVVIDT